jgi:hypothetical protein
MENAEFQNILWEHCSIYQFLDKLEKPIISRHGLKGGRFIDSLVKTTPRVTSIAITRQIDDLTKRARSITQ